MEGIKETELSLQREVVTTLDNTWLVEAVNPSTGEKKMINIANYASVVAGIMNLSSKYVRSFVVNSEDEIYEQFSTMERGMYVYQVFASDNSYLSNGLYIVHKRIGGNDVSWSQTIIVLCFGTALKYRKVTGNTSELVYGDWVSL